MVTQIVGTYAHFSLNPLTPFSQKNRFPKHTLSSSSIFFSDLRPFPALFFKNSSGATAPLPSPPPLPLRPSLGWGEVTAALLISIRSFLIFHNP
jgi:hypothetical protein